MDGIPGAHPSSAVTRSAGTARPGCRMGPAPPPRRATWPATGRAAAAAARLRPGCRRPGCRRPERRRPERRDLIQEPVEARILDRQGEVRRAERRPQLHGRDHRDQQLTVGPRQHGARRAVGGQGGHRAPHPHRVVVGVRGEDQSSGRARPRDDPLGEAFPVVLHEPDRASHHGTGTPVVGLEVHAPQPRQRGGQAQDAPHVREPPAVDRLVVIAHEEHPVRWRRQQQRDRELCAVEVLRLIHEQLRAARAPAGQDGAVGLEQPQRPGHEVVEVHPARSSGSPARMR